MKLDNGKYIHCIGWGQGMHYLQGPQMTDLEQACKSAMAIVEGLDKGRAPGAPKPTVYVLKVEGAFKKVGL